MSGIALHRISDETQYTITRRVKSTAEKMITQFSPIINETELYKQLIPKENFEILYNASHLMERFSHVNNSFRAITYKEGQTALNVRYMMIYRDNEPHISWLWPTYMNFISTNTELGEKLIPIVDMARRWQTVLKLMEDAFKDLKPAMVMYFMPWLKIIIREILEGYYIENKNELVRLLDQPRPRNIPSVNSWLFRMFREGEVLLTQYSIVKDNNYKVDSGCAIIAPCFQDSLIYPKLSEEYNEFKSTLR